MGVINQNGWNGRREEEVERKLERERLAGKAKEVEEEKKREKEVNAEKQARLARWKESSPKI